MNINQLAPVGGADLQALTRELNLLDRTRDDHVYQLGLKLIPIRQILQQMNGTTSGMPGADNLNPKGWSAWRDSAGIPPGTASAAIQRAVDPEGHRKKTSKESRQQRGRPSGAIRQLKRAWPNWTAEERAQVIATVRALATEANRAAA